MYIHARIYVLCCVQEPPAGWFGCSTSSAPSFDQSKIECLLCDILKATQAEKNHSCRMLWMVCAPAIFSTKLPLISHHVPKLYIEFPDLLQIQGARDQGFLRIYMVFDVQI